MMVINNNLPALNAYDIVNNTSNQLQKSIQKLSTGLRINSAADDAAGLSISEKMRAQINGLDQAVRNTQDGISLIQTAEGALTETHSILQRMRELSVQAANDTYTAQDRSYIQEEVDLLREEIDHIGNTTTFNTKKLLNGDSAILWSSSDNNTKALVRGGLRTIDQFGQKSSAEGNYKITVKSTVGQGEVQKSDIFKLKHDVSPWYADIDSTKGVAAVDKQTAPEIKGGGTYTVSISDIPTTASTAGTATKVSQVGGTGGAFETVTPGDLTTNADVTFKVKSVSTTSGSESVIFEVSGKEIAKDGTVTDKDWGTLEYSTTGVKTHDISIGGVNSKFAWTSAVSDMAKKFQEGDEIVYNMAAGKAVGDIVVTVAGDPDSGSMTDHTYVLTKEKVQDKNIDFAVSYVETDATDPDYKEIQHGTVSVRTNTNFAENATKGQLVKYYKNSSTSNDVEQEHWMSSVNSAAINSATLSVFPEGGSYQIDAETVAVRDGTWTTLKSTGKDYFQTGGGLSLSAASGIAASGILELTIGASTLDNTPANAKLVVTGHFYGMGKDGAAIDSDITVAGGSIAGDGTASAVTIGTVALGSISVTSGTLAESTSNYKQGDKIYIQVGAAVAANDSVWTVSGQNEDGSNAFKGYTPTYVVTPANSKTYNMRGLVFSEKGEDIDWTTALSDSDNRGQAAVTTAATGATAANMAGKTVASFRWGADNPTEIKSSIGEVADGTNRLRDIDKFWDSQGNFLLEDPQTLTITQGDGKTAKVTLYAQDTLNDMATKINDAIANDLGQGQYVDVNGRNRFATYVDSPTEKTSESVQGTMLIRSVVPGAQGTLTFSSNNEDLINALSLNTIQSATESSYLVTVQDAHSGEIVNGIEDEKITGNVLVGKLHPNVDVEFDALTGISATWDKNNKKFVMSSDKEGDVTFLHLTDNTTVFQIGANEGDDLGINIGDMRSHALGLDGVLVTNRDAASRSISIIDSAIDKVSTQRAKLGAYQNRLEHTSANLTTSSENLTAAESRIRDTDMAKEMMNFTKLQIMLQAGNSMLAQANQLPQNVLSLIR